MISIKEALSIRDGDYIYDYYGYNLKVLGYIITYEQGEVANIEFNCIEINTNQRFLYRYEDIYLNVDDLSDEQKIFLRWLRNNTKDPYYYDLEEIKKIEKAFMTGFSLGYSYKNQKLSEEQLQK